MANNGRRSTLILVKRYNECVKESLSKITCSFTATDYTGPTDFSDLTALKEIIKNNAVSKNIDYPK